MPSYKHINANLVLESERGNDIVFEGSTTSITTTLTRTDPTANRTITFPDASGTVALTSDISSGGVTIPIEFTGTTYNTYLDFDESTANNETIWLPANRSGRLAIADGDRNVTDSMGFYSTNSGAPELELTQYNTSGANGPVITFNRQMPNTNRNGDEIGRIDFQSMKDGNVTEVYGSIIGKIAVDNNPGPGGWIEFEVSDMNANDSTKMMTVFGGTTASQFDQGVRIDNGHLWMAPSPDSRNGKIVFEQSSGFDTILQASTSGTAIAGVYNTLPREGGLILTTNNFNYENIAGMSTLPSGLTIQRDEDGTLPATLTFYKNSTTPADNDYLAIIDFEGENSAGQQQEFAGIRAVARDVTDGTEDGYLALTSYVGGSFKTMATIGQSNEGTGVVINTGDLVLADYTSGTIIFEGTTNNNFETTLRVLDPTGDRTISLPDKSGTIALLEDAGAFTVLSTKTLEGVGSSQTVAGEEFGYSVDVSGNYMIVGAKYWHDGTSFAGTAYIFDVSSGSLVHQLENPDSSASGDQFGYAVGISGNYAIVTAPYEDPGGVANTGRAYIFDVTSGALLHTLKPLTSQQDEQFGRSAAIHGKYSVVGAPYRDYASDTDSGIICVFNNETGERLYTIENPSLGAGGSLDKENDRFGWSVDISDHYIVVSAPDEDVNLSSSAGIVYVYDLSDGSRVHTLEATVPGFANRFGYSVAIDGNFIVIGEPDWNSNRGQAHIYNATTGLKIHTISNPNPSSGDHFGQSVDISSNYAVIGAPGESSDSGAAYVFNVSTGELVDTIDNPNDYDTADGDGFGRSVGISGNNIIVGAPDEDNSTTYTSTTQEPGRAYVFNTSGDPYTYSPYEIHSFPSRSTVGFTTEITTPITSATGTVTHDLEKSAVFNHSSITANFTANFTNVPETLNRTVSVALILNQGSTAYMPTAVQIDGTSETVLWQGGSAPSGTASGIDIVSFTLIRPSTSTWKVIGAATSYS